MRILSREISDRTATLVSQIEHSVRFPIQYFDISKRPNKNDSVAGTVDVHPADRIYKVWLQSTLPQEPFEADVLHELRHIPQIESGYSEVYSKNTADFYSPDKPFIQDVCAHLSSVILDIDVNIWLTRNGYSYDFFSAGNFNALLKNKNHRYIRLDDPLNFANLCLALLHAALSSGGSSMQTLCDAYSSYPQLTCTASRLYDGLTATAIDNPKASLLGHCFVVDSLDLWKYYYVVAPGVKIRTRKEYDALLLLPNTGRGIGE